MNRIVPPFLITLAAVLCAGAAAARPGPPPDWASTLSQPLLRAGGIATYRYSATSADPLRLHISVQTLPRQLRVVGNAAWTLEFPGEHVVTKRVNIKVRVRPIARARSRLCLTLRQYAVQRGLDDVVAKRVCGRVRA